MKNRGGTMILYACDVGQTAEDGCGEHGTLTTQLLASMREGRRPVDVFNEVSREVSRLTDGKQVPWNLSNHFPIDWKFSTGGSDEDTASTSTSAVPMTGSANPATKRQRNSAEAESSQASKAARRSINAPGRRWLR